MLLRLPQSVLFITRIQGVQTQLLKYWALHLAFLRPHVF